MIKIKLPPYSSRTIYLKVFADVPQTYTLIQETTTQSSGRKANHVITIESIYPPDFSEGGIEIIIGAILAAVAIFILRLRKEI